MNDSIVAAEPVSNTVQHGIRYHIEVCKNFKDANAEITVLSGPLYTRGSAADRLRALLIDGYKAARENPRLNQRWRKFLRSERDECKDTRPAPFDVFAVYWSEQCVSARIGVALTGDE